MSNFHKEIRTLRDFLEYQHEQAMCIRQLVVMLKSSDYLLVTGAKLEDEEDLRIESEKIEATNRRLINMVRSDPSRAVMSLYKWVSVRNGYILGGISIISHILVLMHIVFAENFGPGNAIDEVLSILDSIAVHANVSEADYTGGDMERGMMNCGNRLYASFLGLAYRVKQEYETQSTKIVRWVTDEEEQEIMSNLFEMQREISSVIVILNIFNEFEQGDIHVLKFIGQVDDQREVDESDAIVNFDTRASGMLLNLEKSNLDYENRVKIYRTSIEETRYKKKDAEKEKEHSDEKDSSLIGSIKALVFGMGRDDVSIGVMDKNAMLSKEYLQDSINLLRTKIEDLNELVKHNVVNSSDVLEEEIRVSETLLNRKLSEMNKSDKIKHTAIGRIGERFSNFKLMEMIKNENDVYFGNNKQFIILTKIIKNELSYYTEKLTPSVLNTVASQLQGRFEKKNIFGNASPWVYGKLPFWYVLVSVFIDTVLNHGYFSPKQTLVVRLLHGTLSRYSMVPTWTIISNELGIANRIVTIKRSGVVKPEINEMFNTYVLMLNFRNAITPHFRGVDTTEDIYEAINSVAGEKDDDLKKFIAMVFIVCAQSMFGAPEKQLTLDQIDALFKLGVLPSDDFTLFKQDVPKDKLLNAFKSAKDLKTLAAVFLKLFDKLDLAKIVDLDNFIPKDLQEFIQVLKETLTSKVLVNTAEESIKDVKAVVYTKVFNEIKALNLKPKENQALFTIVVVYLSKFADGELTPEKFKDLVRIHSDDPNADSFLLGKPSDRKAIFIALKKALDNIKEEDQERINKLVKTFRNLLDKIDPKKLLK